MDVGPAVGRGQIDGQTVPRAREMHFTGESYELSFAEDRPYAYLNRVGSGPIAELFALSSVNSTEGLDDTTATGQWTATGSAEETVFTLHAESSAWAEKTYRFRCRSHGLRYEISVNGCGDLTDVNYFGGFSSAWPRWGSGFFPSGMSFQAGFNPEPEIRDTASFDPAGTASIDLTGGPLPGRRHWFFNPAPFCFAFRHAGGWLGAGVETMQGENSFSEYAYTGGNSFYLTLRFDGRTRVNGRYELPSIGLTFAQTEYEALAAHVSSVQSAETKRAAPSSSPTWWQRPMFCGWGAQCARAAADNGYTVADGQLPNVHRFLATMFDASQYARQNFYEEALAHLARHRLHPGSIVIDDKWQQTYGENLADSVKWPDLRGFIQTRHAAGQHVLLWLKAWDSEGIPNAQCIRNAAGTPLAVDPTNPSYAARLRAAVRHMLSPEGYDADGFKIDFTHRIPVGPGLVLHKSLHGLELMKCLLTHIHDEAKRVKPDALIITHTPHPYLADVLDTVRLNDMLDLTRLDDPLTGPSIEDTVRRRARVARIACPEALIDTDNWPVRNRAAWRDYTRLQPTIGVPSLYFTDRIDLTQEPFEEADYALLREVWTS